MSERVACSAYRPKSDVCSNGFIQRHFCWSGQWSDKYPPYCLMDELPEHLVTDDGKPVFAATPTSEASHDQ